jgi:acetate kinase
MKVLVINAGSSSLKYQFIQTGDGSVITKGLIEKIGGQAEYGWQRKNGEKVKESVPIKDHTGALHIVIDNLKDSANGFIQSLSEIEAIGHRVVHGGDEFYKSVLINDHVIESIDKFSELAPLHNPPNLQGIRSCRAVLPDTKQVAVFDTAFHQTMPESSYLYAIPWEYYDKYKIRRYGFHGTSHRYVSMKAAEFTGKKLEDFNCITCHLGNGSSITAVKGGKSVDTTMGMTPLEGVVMGTRSGSIDPAIIFFLMEKEDISTRQINDVLNKKSGLLGLSGVSNDLREVTAAAKEGNRRAQLTREVLVKSIRRAIGAYMAELGRVDAILFTAGIGENETSIRELCIAGMENFGVELDVDKNAGIRGQLADVSKPTSRTKVLVVPTNEELMIAMETQWVIEGKE